MIEVRFFARRSVGALSSSLPPPFSPRFSSEVDILLTMIVFLIARVSWEGSWLLRRLPFFFAVPHGGDEDEDCESPSASTSAGDDMRLMTIVFLIARVSCEGSWLLRRLPFFFASSHGGVGGGGAISSPSTTIDVVLFRTVI